MMEILKNIPRNEVFEMKNLIQADAGQIVSKTLVQNEALNVTLFAFAPDEEISSHRSEGDAMATMLEGEGRFTVDGKIHLLKAGESLLMPAGLPHAIYSLTSMKWMLLVVFPTES